MKRIGALMAGLALVVMAGTVYAQEESEHVTAAFEFELEDHARGERLHVNARISGIKPSEKFEYYFRWTSPSDVFQDSVYPEVDSEKRLYAGDDSCKDLPEGDPRKDSTECQCYCRADEKDHPEIERGCWRTRALRTIVYTTDKGTVYRATGSWKVELFRRNRDGVDSLIGSANYEVN